MAAAFPEFFMLSVSLCIKFWFFHVFPKCLKYVAFSKDLSSTFMRDFVLYFADSVVSIEKLLQAGWSRVHITEGAWDFSLIQRVQTSSGDHQSPYTVGTWVLAGVTWLGHDVDHSPPSSTKVMNKWIYTFIPRFLYGVDRDNFIFFLLIWHENILSFLMIYF
jgi:hypothetical protein